MKNAHRYFSILFPMISILFLSPAYSTYQYTFTTNTPYDYFENFYSNEFNENQWTRFSANDALKLVITSEELLKPGLSTEEYLAKATFDFSAGEFSVKAAFYPDTEVPPPLGQYSIYSFLELTTVDSTGLPTDWYFSARRYMPYGFGDGENEEFITGSDPTFNVPLSDYGVVMIDTIVARGGGRIYGYAQGEWTLNEISSPVPELPECAMLLVGLGLISFVNNRKRENRIN